MLLRCLAWPWVLLALPLTLLGSMWGLLLADLPLDQMGQVGAVALIGLTVNPAILLVDRMQQRVRSGSTPAGTAPSTAAATGMLSSGMPAFAQ